MKVRRFLIENEKGQQFRLDNLNEGCFLTSPGNLGYSYSIDFVQLGFEFIENNRKIEQSNPNGIAYFRSYDKIKEFVDFIESSLKLKWLYIVPFETGERTYYRDVILKKIEKTEKKGKWLACPVEFASKSLWYEQNETIFKIETYEDEMRYDYRWNSRYIDYNIRAIQFNNKGHIEAPFQVEIDGFVQNPSISIFIDDEEFASIKIPITIKEYEKLLYSSKTGEIYIQKQNTDGTLENLWKQEYIDIQKQNIFKLPLGVSEIRLTADDDIANAKLVIFPQYKAV
nr:MAG TPA: Baseplate protein [Caudoviricetes sp.]